MSSVDSIATIPIRRLLYGLLVLCLCAMPALASYTVTSQGTANTTAAAHSLTVGSLTIGAGTLVIVGCNMNANISGDAITITDSASNSWTAAGQEYNPTGTIGGGISWSILTSGLSSGTISCSDTTTGTTNFSHAAMWVATVTGAASSSPEDTAVRAVHNGTSTTSPTITSGTPSIANELFIVIYSAGASNTGVYTEDPNWTNFESRIGNGGLTLSAAYLTNSGTGTEQHNPTTVSASYAQVVTGFKPSGSPPPTCRPGSLAMMGVGC